MLSERGHVCHSNGTVFLRCWTFHLQCPIPVRGQTSGDKHSSANNVEVMRKRSVQAVTREYFWMHCWHRALTCQSQ